MGKKTWTAEQEAYLYDSWGTVPTARLAQELNKSVKAVKNKAARLGLSSAWDNATGIPLKDVAYLVGKSPSTISTVWVHKHHLRTIEIHRNLHVVEDGVLARFMQYNKNLWIPSQCDYDYFRPYAWFQRALELEKQSTMKRYREPWNDDEMRRLDVLRMKGYTYKEIGYRLNRTASSCRHNWIKRHNNG